MSKITLFQCDMCRERGEDLFTFKVKFPIVDFEDEESNDATLERGGGPRVEYVDYDFCENCVRKLRKFIETFHKTNVPENPDEQPEPDGLVWFIEYKIHGKTKWSRENGPFIERKDAEEALNQSQLVNPSYQHRISCRVVPAWVVNFIDCNMVKE